jgi:hypothetical protein
MGDGIHLSYCRFMAEQQGTKGNRWTTITIGGLLLVVGLLLGLLLGRDGTDNTPDLATQGEQNVSTTSASPTTTEGPAEPDTPTTSTSPPAAADTTTTSAPTSTTEPPAQSQAELAGCVSNFTALPEGSIVADTFVFDFDGVDGDELVSTYFDPANDAWLLRVAAADGSLSSELPLPASSAIGALPITVVDSNADSAPELVVKIDGGAYSQIMAFAVVVDCEVELTRNLEGQVYSWPVGASVSSISGFECSNAYVIFRQGALTDETIWAYQTYSNALNGIVWEPIGTAGSSYSGETEDETPPFAADVDCAAVPFEVQD